MATQEKPPAEAKAKGFAAQVFSDEGVTAILIALSIIGVALNEFSRLYGFWYWIAMAPVFAGFSLATYWSSPRAKAVGRARMIRDQLLHWGGLAAAVLLVYLIIDHFQIEQLQVRHSLSGLIALLLLALTTFLAGVHFSWRLVLVALLQVLALIMIAFLREYIWIFFIVAVLALLAAVFYWKINHKRQIEGQEA
jgi:uncharacterized membrane protein